MSGALAKVPTGAVIHGQQTAADVIARAQLVRQVLEATMKADVHYGIVPGTEKPSLWQPGAEKIDLVLGLAPEYEVEETLVDGDRGFLTTCRLRSIHTGEIVGSGVGYCSTGEEKYAWRAAVCQEEYDATAHERRREKWRKGKGEAYKTLQVHTTAADMANTALKMSTKRAHVAATKSTAAASDIFSQDLEELADQAHAEASGEPRGTMKRPQAKSAGASSTPAAAASTTAPAAPPAPADGSTALWPGIPNEAIAEIVEAWPQAGAQAISDPQRKRIFGIGMGKGWKADQISGGIKAAFGVDAGSFPAGKAYDLLCTALGSFGPPA